MCYFLLKLKELYWLNPKYALLTAPRLIDGQNIRKTKNEEKEFKLLNKSFNIYNFCSFGDKNGNYLHFSQFIYTFPSKSVQITSCWFIDHVNFTRISPAPDVCCNRDLNWLVEEVQAWKKIRNYLGVTFAPIPFNWERFFDFEKCKTFFNAVRFIDMN